MHAGNIIERAHSKWCNSVVEQSEWRDRRVPKAEVLRGAKKTVSPSDEQTMFPLRQDKFLKYKNEI